MGRCVARQYRCPSLLISSKTPEWLPQQHLFQLTAGLVRLINQHYPDQIPAALFPEKEALFRYQTTSCRSSFTLVNRRNC